MNGIFGNSGANSNRTVHPGGKFSGKGNTFRGISFFSLLPEFQEISVPFLLTYKCQAPRGNTSENSLRSRRIKGRGKRAQKNVRSPPSPPPLYTPATQAIPRKNAKT